MREHPIYPTPAHTGYCTHFLDSLRAVFPALVPKKHLNDQDQPVPQMGAASGVTKLTKVQRTWRLRATPVSTGPRFVPTSGELELRLIEPPFEILRGRITP